MAKRDSTFSTDKLFKGLKGLLASLPSQEEKKELLQTIGETGRFLEEFKSLVESIPTLESSRELSEGMSRLDILTERAAKDTGLQKLLGLRGGGAPHARSPLSSEETESRAKGLEDQLSSPGGTETLAILESTREPVSVLMALAARLGLRTRSRERKFDLVKRIATHVNNQRGYRLLRGEEPAVDNLTIEDR